MEALTEYIATIDEPQHRERVEEIFAWISEKFPTLKAEIKWNQPMFTDHGTYIIGFSTAKQHMSVAPEEVGMTHFADDITEAGYSMTKGLFRIRWKDQVNYDLLEKMISFNIQDKADCTTFWR
ncbi:iron chaperone [Bacillus sp. PS06]|uniref:iron chaperone n=1 Tax=Bacillus sp. PS06 TaxID=2764176 RepID=UPI00177C5577|nr:iron chaperone [Bacillus sp. PS06]MBD8070041.1 iron chaperone [Bacillus sp. PS06]